LGSSIGTSGLGSAITFGRAGFDTTVLDLKISALEASGSGRVISSPKVLTLDGESAKIEQGTSIPYQSVSDQGTTTEFQDAT
jgi:type IV pilus assembly protein PilQ